MAKSSASSLGIKLLGAHLRDFSLEAPRPPLDKPQKGEQELQLALSVHQAKTGKPGYYEVLLASRLVIWHTPTRQPLLVADHAYSGMFHVNRTDKETVSEADGLLLKPILQQCAENLYPKARESLEQHLELIGHTPPLPESIDFNEVISKT